VRERADVPAAVGSDARDVTEPIIVAVDPRHEDVAPAALGAMFAQLFDAPLVLAATYAVDLSIENLHPAYASALGDRAHDAVERVAASVGDIPVTTTALANGSSPARALHALAEREAARLLVIGPSRRGTVGRAAPAAVTDRLLHGAPCPVAVAPPGFTPTPLELIGAAYVERPDGDAALAYAEDIAERAHASVHVLSVAEPPPARVDGALEPLAIDYVRLAREEAAKMALEDGTRAVPEDLSAGGRLLSGPAADALARASRDLDLLVCGSRGHGSVRSVLLGTTSHALVRRAACPVVVVPIPGEHHDRS
jgi:nucleotide-binding universal stress UspA family protein